MENKIQQIELTNKAQIEKHKKGKKVKVDFFQLLSQQKTKINKEKEIENLDRKYNQKQAEFNLKKQNVKQKDNNVHLQANLNPVTAENNQLIKESKTLVENKILAKENLKKMQADKDEKKIEKINREDSKIQYTSKELKLDFVSDGSKNTDTKISELEENHKPIPETLPQKNQNLLEEKYKSIKENFATPNYKKLSEDINISSLGDGYSLKTNLNNHGKNEIHKIFEVKKDENYSFSNQIKNKATENKIINESYKDLTSKVYPEKTSKELEQQNLNIAYPMFEFDKSIDKRVERYQEPLQKTNINVDQPYQITENIVFNLEDIDLRQNNFTDTNSQQYSYNNILKNENNEQAGKFTLSVNFMDTKINIHTVSNNLIMYINTQQILSQSVIEGIQKILSETGYNNHNLIVKDKNKTTKVYLSNTQSTQNRKNEGLSILA